MNFTVYSKNGCPFCTKIVEVLQIANQEYKVYKLGVDFTKEQFYSEFGQGSTFPQVVVNDTHLGGCMDTVTYLRENNLI